MSADGSDVRKLTDGASQNFGACFSPDGARIAFISTRDGNREIYVMNADGSGAANVTNDAADDWLPSWSANGAIE